MSNIAKALELLRKDGWVKELLFRNGAHCARGALLRVAGESLSPACQVSVTSAPSWCAWRLMESDDELLGEIATELFPDRIDLDRWKSQPLVSFNNHPDTTFEDIEQVFEKAILREQEQI